VSYASVAELNAYDSSVTATDDEIQAALDFTTALVTARARRTFSASSATAVTVHDVRTRNVVVDLPFSNVTAVAVDGHELPSSSYAVEPWGIRLLSAPRIAFDGYGPSVEPWGTRPFSNPLLDLDGYGSSVTVTATFTSVVPELIKRATILLALVDLNGGSSSGNPVLPKLPANVKSFAVEGLSVTLADGSGTGRIPTGDAEADRLIDLVMETESGVV
jgi:hypothetical protein